MLLNIRAPSSASAGAVTQGVILAKPVARPRPTVSSNAFFVIPPSAGIRKLRIITQTALIVLTRPGRNRRPVNHLLRRLTLAAPGVSSSHLPRKVSISNSLGNAAISLDLASTATCPKTAAAPRPRC